MDDLDISKGMGKHLSDAFPIQKGLNKAIFHHDSFSVLS
jgi:hypothetical protein